MTSMQNVFWKCVENGLQLKVGGLHISCTTYIQYIKVLRLSRHVNIYRARFTKVWVRNKRHCAGKLTAELINWGLCMHLAWVSSWMHGYMSISDSMRTEDANRLFSALRDLSKLKLIAVGRHFCVIVLPLLWTAAALCKNTAHRQDRFWRNSPNKSRKRHQLYLYQLYPFSWTLWCMTFSAYGSALIWTEIQNSLAVDASFIDKPRRWTTS